MVLAGKTLDYVNCATQYIMGGLGYSKTTRGARIEQISHDVIVIGVGGGSKKTLTDLWVS
jgi:hypothetical protein